MRIAILNNAVPFLRGGAEHLADALELKLREFGHSSAVFRLPFRWNPPEKIPEHILACRLMKLPNVDLVIAFKFPAFYVPHPNKVIWLLHQFRQAYDFWGTTFQDLPDTAAGRAIRNTIVTSDNNFLPEAKRIYTNSSVTGDRLRKFNNIESEILLPPLLSDSHFHCQEYGDFIVCLGRVNAVKRQHLLVKAMKYCRTNVKLVVAGKSESESESAAILQIIKAENLSQKVIYIDRFVSEEEKVDMLSRCLGCAYIPYDEDSYGYVTLEGCLSSKPVITCTDSGGIDMLARNNETGYVVEPDPKAIAESFDRLYSDRQCAMAMGKRALEHALSFNINWEHVIKKLTS